MRKVLRAVFTILLVPVLALAAPAPATAATATPDFDARGLAAPVVDQLTATGISLRFLKPENRDEALVCRLVAHYHFEGLRAPNGAVSGRFDHDTAVDCTTPQIRLTTKSEMFYQGVRHHSTATADCRATDVAPCRSAFASDGFSCGFCNGVWYSEGIFVLDLDPGFYTVQAPPECQETGFFRYTCILRTSRGFL